MEIGKLNPKTGKYLNLVSLQSDVSILADLFEKNFGKCLEKDKTNLFYFVSSTEFFCEAGFNSQKLKYRTFKQQILFDF